MSKIYTTLAAADYLGVTPSRVRQLIIEGKLKSQKYGRDHLIEESALKRYLKEGQSKQRKISKR